MNRFSELAFSKLSKNIYFIRVYTKRLRAIMFWMHGSHLGILIPQVKLNLGLRRLFGHLQALHDKNLANEKHSLIPFSASVPILKIRLCNMECELRLGSKQQAIVKLVDPLSCPLWNSIDWFSHVWKVEWTFSCLNSNNRLIRFTVW